MLYSQVNDTFFLLVTVFDTKIRYLNRSVSLHRELFPRSHCFHSSCNRVCWTFLFSLSQFTHYSQKERCIKLDRQKAMTLKKNMAVKNAIFMLGESGSWKHQSQ